MGAIAFALWAWDGTHWWVNGSRQRSDYMVVDSQRITFKTERSNTTLTIPLDTV